MRTKASSKLGVLALSSILVLGCGGNGNVFEPLADKSSTEACKVDVSQNLDKGNYDAVLSSSCASPIDKGAAYLGKAGFDITDVIDRLIDGSKPDRSKDAVDLYVKALVPQVKPDTIEMLDKAEESYRQSNTPDGEFYTAITQSLKGLTLIKTVIVSGSESGKLMSECDLNKNGVPDDVDATACALQMAGGTKVPASSTPEQCPTFITSQLTFKSEGYLGITFRFTGSKQNCLTEYKKVYYKDSKGIYWLATTSGVCKATEQQTGKTEDWPCPVGGKNQDFVKTVSTNFDSMVDLIGRTIKIDSDIRKSIENIKKEACGYDKECTSEEIANYIKNIKINKN
ncbi:MAG: hypothetical protein N2Z80_04345 [Hydrogenothermaceae bacterium]|nr:hypothetical protein [Hydrogenothermaceae bacterium]